MSGTRIFFIFLILILVAFVAIQVVGVSRNSVKTPSAAKGGGDDSVSCDDYPVFCSMNSILDPFGPKLELKQKTFTVTKAAPELLINVDPDDKNSFRQAAFKFQQGNNCATVQYISNAVGCPPPGNECAPSGGSDTGNSDCKLKYQTWPSCKDGLKGKLSIVKGGGKLAIRLTGPGPCVVALQ